MQTSEKDSVTDSDVSDEEPIVFRARMNESVMPGVVSGNPCESDNENFSHTQYIEPGPRNPQNPSKKEKTTCHAETSDRKISTEECEIMKDLELIAGSAEETIEPVSLVGARKSVVQTAESIIVCLDPCDSGINSETEEDANTCPQTTAIEDFEKKLEPETTTEWGDLKKEGEKHEKTKEVRRLVATINLQPRWYQPRDCEITYSRSDGGMGKLSGPLSPKNGATASFEPTDMKRNQIKSPDLEEGIQSDRNNPVVTADNLNADCCSARVGGTKELTSIN